MLFFNDTFSSSLAEDVLKAAKYNEELNASIRKMFHVKPTEEIKFEVLIDNYYKVYEGSITNSSTGEVIYPDAKMMRSLLNQKSYLIFRSTVVKSEWGGSIVTIVHEIEDSMVLLQGNATFVVKK